MNHVLLGDVYTPIEAARAAGVCKATIMTWMKSGQIRSYKLGRRFYIPATELMRFATESFSRLADRSVADECGVKNKSRAYSSHFHGHEQHG